MLLYRMIKFAVYGFIALEHGIGILGNGLKNLNLSEQLYWLLILEDVKLI
jgi:hypothetical protein